MYPSRGNNAYGQQQQQQQQQQQAYSGQSAYGQNLSLDGGANQTSMSARHSAMLGGHPSTGAQYGGQYASVYGSMALNHALEAPGASARESGPSSNFSVLSQKYGQKDVSEYSPGDRLLDRAGGYAARNPQNEPTARFGDSVSFGQHQHQGDMYSRMNAGSAVRKEMLQAQTIQSASIEGSTRQADYLATKAATIHHTGQQLSSYNGRHDDMAHRGQHPPSILGAAPPRGVDLVYAQTSGYGVSLPPGRDYGKALHSTTPPQGAILPRGGYDRKNDRGGQGQGHSRELDRKAEDLRREVLRGRDKERERKRDLERRERERDRENKRVTEKKRKRTPPRIEPPSSHRRRSPAKEKRRDYVCKVNSSGLLDVGRDYLSVEKRYPRLFTSPECSKVTVNWSRENLKIPLNVPVSFEHEFVQDDKETQNKEASITIKVDDTVKLEHGTTRWNAKFVLMSGLSQNALEELSSERDYEDRIPHFCNMIRFALLKNGNTLKAIGGLWETVDGNDPSVDKSTLVHTALRYAKDLTGLDLKNCQHWNPFLEIHYDRVKKDGTFSHKEITVLYIPDLSDCLPSVDAWRDQWLAHKKPGTNKDLKKDTKLEKVEVSGSAESASELKEKSEDKVKEPEKAELQNNPIMEKKSGVETEIAGVQTTGSGKKKIVKKIIKKKVVKKDTAENTSTKCDTSDSKKVVETVTDTETAGQGQGQGQSQGQSQGQGQESTGNNTPVVKTPTKKKVIKRVPVKKAVKKEDEGTITETIAQGQSQSQSQSQGQGQGQESTDNTPVVKTLTKTKVIKKVPVKKAVKKKDDVAQSEVTPVKEQVSSENKPTVKKTVKKKIVKRVMKKKVVVDNDVNKDDVADKSKVTIEEQKKDENEIKGENEKEEKNDKIDSGSSSSSKMEGIIVQSENNEILKSGEKLKETKGKDVKDNKKDEEVPRHPGLFLQIKESSKFRSSSLSLDSLLNYDDNDIEESTFELSLFAETFYEMLQYQMGSRILSFLQKLRIKFVAKRNEKKRQLEETSEKEKAKINNKRLKTDDSEVKVKSVENEIMEEDEKIIPKVENMVENTKSDEDENMTDASSKDDTNLVKNEEEEKIDMKKKKENIDKELLQAFRFFDKNRVGHIRVEDMRLIIHNLGNFLSHREVKELVQSALLESNTGRDDRILYNKLVRMSDI